MTMYESSKFERRRDARLSVEELKDVSVEAFIDIAKDKWKSRSLQRSLMESDEVVAKLIYSKAEPIFTQLLSDQYGNYLSQKILEYCTDEQFDLLFSKVEAKLSNLANEVHGTRAVQKFVEEGVKRNRSDKILLSLRDHVEPLSRSVTGFHVVVKLLEKLGEEDVEEILGKLCRDAAAVVSMGRDQWGCCVLKACIDTAKGERLQVIVDAIVNHTLELVQDPYGNYVVQHVLASTAFLEVLPEMINSLKDHVLDLCQQKFSSNVLEKLLTTAPDQHKQVLIQGVLSAGKLETAEVAKHLLFHQYGNYVVQQTLAVAKDPQHTILLEAVRPYVHQVLRHLFEGDPSTPALPTSSTSLQPEQAQRLAMKLVKRFPALLEGLEEHERAMLSGSHHLWGNDDNNVLPGFGGYHEQAYNPWMSHHHGAGDHYGAMGGYFNPMWNPNYAAALQWAQYSHLLALGQAAAGQAAGKFGGGGKGKFGGGGHFGHGGHHYNKNKGFAGGANPATAMGLLGPMGPGGPMAAAAAGAMPMGMGPAGVPGMAAHHHQQNAAASAAASAATAAAAAAHTAAAQQSATTTTYNKSSNTSSSASNISSQNGSASNAPTAANAGGHGSGHGSTTTSTTAAAPAVPSPTPAPHLSGAGAGKGSSPQITAQQLHQQQSAAQLNQMMSNFTSGPNSGLANANLPNAAAGWAAAAQAQNSAAALAAAHQGAVHGKMSALLGGAGVQGPGPAPGVPAAMGGAMPMGGPGGPMANVGGVQGAGVGYGSAAHLAAAGTGPAGAGKGAGKNYNYYTAYAQKAAHALASLNAMQQVAQASPMSSAGMPGTPGMDAIGSASGGSKPMHQSPWAYPNSDYNSSPEQTQSDEMARVVGFWPNYQISYEEQ